MKEKLENLKKQQEASKELFIKLQGAIEFIEGVMREEKDERKKDNKST